MAGTDGVESTGFHQLDPPLFSAVDGGRSKRTIIMVHAAALQLDHLAVDEESRGGIKLQGADAEGYVRMIYDFAVINHFNLSAIKTRTRKGPQRWLWDGKDVRIILAFLSQNPNLSLLGGNGLAIGTDQAGPQSQRGLGAASILNGGCDIYCR